MYKKVLLKDFNIFFLQLLLVKGEVVVVAAMMLFFMKNVLKIERIDHGKCMKEIG